MSGLSSKLREPAFALRARRDPHKAHHEQT